jgi:hypothetical protein
MKKQIGVWLDSKEATIIALVEDQEPQINRIRSGIHTGHSKGGWRTASPWGPTSVVSESKILEKRTHEENDYFERVIAAVQGADEVFIFGPSEAKDHLLNVIKDERKHFHPSLRAVLTADKMTLNQKIARVREFFEN